MKLQDLQEARLYSASNFYACSYYYHTFNEYTPEYPDNVTVKIIGETNAELGDYVLSGAGSYGPFNYTDTDEDGDDWDGSPEEIEFSVARTPEEAVQGVRGRFDEFRKSNNSEIGRLIETQAEYYGE